MTILAYIIVTLAIAALGISIDRFCIRKTPGDSASIGVLYITIMLLGTILAVLVIV